MMQNKDFAAFILTHGRPDNIKTYRSLKNQGYTGKVYFIIDNEDKTADRYKELYGDKVIIFNKKAIAKTFDNGDNFNDRRAIIYARNASFEIAKQLGITYFIQLDDDYTGFHYRFTETLDYYANPIKNLDAIFDLFLAYYKKIPAKSIALAQGGDYIGGGAGSTAKVIGTKRKAMNSFICSTERPFKFIGRVNEDVNTYTSLGNKGELFLTINAVSLVQLTSQTNSGGMTELYKNEGTYIKSFYTVMYCPAFVKISEIGPTNYRLHHKINWKHAVPQIISADHKKK